MKKLLAALAACVLLAGCALPRAAFSPLRYFTGAFTLAHGDYAVEGNITCNSYEDIRLAFTHPQALRFFTVTLTSGAVLTDTAGKADEIALPELPAAAPLRLLGEALRKSVYGPADFTPRGEDYIAALSLDGTAAECVFAPDGEIKEIRCPAADVSVTFYEIQSKG